MKKRYAFLAGLPRTGSTLLGTLLSQHPELHSTRTSAVRDIMRYPLGYFLGESPYFNLKDPNSQAWGIAKGVLFGAYENIDKTVIIEKDRGWAGEIPVLKRILGEDPRVIAPVRSIPEIIASFMLISKKIGAKSKIEDEVALANRESNTWTLSRVIYEKYIYANYKVFKAAYEAYPECFLLVEYENLVKKPKEVMSLICIYLDVTPWTPTTTSLKNPNPENDVVYGMKGLHDIRPTLERTSPPAWEVLGEKCYEFWCSKNLEFWR
jgi:sulfotransferase